MLLVGSLRFKKMPDGSENKNYLASLKQMQKTVLQHKFFFILEKHMFDDNVKWTVCIFLLKIQNIPDANFCIEIIQIVSPKDILL